MIHHFPLWTVCAQQTPSQKDIKAIQCGFASVHPQHACICSTDRQITVVGFVRVAKCPKNSIILHKQCSGVFIVFIVCVHTTRCSVCFSLFFETAICWFSCHLYSYIGWKCDIDRMLCVRCVSMSVLLCLCVVKWYRQSVSLVLPTHSLYRKVYMQYVLNKGKKNWVRKKWQIDCCSFNAWWFV